MEGKNIWVSILRVWYVLSESEYSDGDTIEVSKKDGSVSTEIVKSCVGTYLDSFIYAIVPKEKEESKPVSKGARRWK